MHPGFITSYFDVAQVTLWLFWLFFAGLIIHIRREDHREGYPLVSDVPGRVPLEETGLLVPAAKTFTLNDGTTEIAPRNEAPEADPLAIPSGSFPGAPLVPTGNPLVDGVGPAAYAMRREIVDVVWETGAPRIVPRRVDPDFFVASEDPDPVGMKVQACDGVIVGTVVDIWNDRSETVLRYLEIELAANGRHVLAPAALITIGWGGNVVRVKSINSAQFLDIPALSNPDQINRREEDRICAYFAGGHLYATPERSEPIL